jgi:hypothetical protein
MAKDAQKDIEAIHVSDVAYESYDNSAHDLHTKGLGLAGYLWQQIVHRIGLGIVRVDRLLQRVAL